MLPSVLARACAIIPALATRWADPLTFATERYGITTPARLAAFLAQTGHESMGFTHTREIWGPTAAQLRYEGRIDLGNTKPGDGSKFRGRGLIQITGRANYAACGRAFAVDLESHPELLEEPGWAARSAAWWWQKHGCNEIADDGNFVLLTRTINGGLNGLGDRRARWDVAKAVLGVP